jgi:hypothetical protein
LCKYTYFSTSLIDFISIRKYTIYYIDTKKTLKQNNSFYEIISKK